MKNLNLSQRADLEEECLGFSEVQRPWKNGNITDWALRGFVGW
jgi:hypothetical protein